MTNDPPNRKPPTRLLEHVENAAKFFLAGRRPGEADLESAVRIFLEFLRGFESFLFEQPCVTVFGSARSGFAVMTGGGSGIMEAANRGAAETGEHFFVRKVMLREGTISAEDMRVLQVADSAAEVVRIVKDHTAVPVVGSVGSVAMRPTLPVKSS